MKTGQSKDTAPAIHEDIEALMPWLARGQVQDDDLAKIDQDVTTSPGYEAELRQEAVLAAVLKDIAAEDAAGDTSEGEQGHDEAWLKFRSRIEAKGVSRDVAKGRQRPLPSHRTSVWRRLPVPKTKLGWVATLQAGALAAVVLLVVPAQITQNDAQNDAQYRTLSSGDGSASLPVGNAVIVFDPATDQATMQALLIQSGARIVDGPLANGGLIVAFRPDTVEAGLQSLQNNSAVMLAEPLDSGDSQ